MRYVFQQALILSLIFTIPANAAASQRRINTDKYVLTYAVAFLSLISTLEQIWFTQSADFIGQGFHIFLQKLQPIAGLNPRELTSDQAERSPLLLEYRNPRDLLAWHHSLAKPIEAGIPIFTIHLPSEKLTPVDQQRVLETLNHIKKLYLQAGKDPSSIEINAIGRSLQKAIHDLPLT